MGDLVSVIMPTYNRGSVIGKAIQSVLNQYYNNIELIIIDDCSKDNTSEIVCSFIKRDSRVKYFKNDVNLGPGKSRNMGMHKSRGKYIAFLDSDDEWLENHLQESVNVLEKEKAFVSFAFWYEKNEKGEITKIYEQELLNHAVENQKPIVGDNYFKFNDRFFEYAITHSFYCYHINTLVFRKSAIESVGMFNDKLRTSEDIDFSLRLIDEYGFCLINNFHFIYCRGNDNLYWFIERKQIDIQEVLKSPILIEKLSFCNTYKCEMLKLRKKYIRNSNKIQNKLACIKECNKKISRKYYAVAFLNKQNDLVKSIYSSLKSLIYDLIQ